MTYDPNNAGDVEEYEEINEIEEYDDVDENGEPIIEYEDDGYDEEYAEEYPEDEYAEDEYPEDEYADEGEYAEEEYPEDEYVDEGDNYPATQDDEKMNRLLSELDAMRNANLYGTSGHGVLHSYNLSEISRLRDETLKNTLQNQITYNNSIFSEINRLKDDVTRNQADSRLQYEIMQLRNEMKGAVGTPATPAMLPPSGGSGNNEYFRDQIRNEIKQEINSLKEELRAERTERQSRQDIERLKAQIAQLQKGQGGKQGFNSGEETGGAAFPENGNYPATNHKSSVNHTEDFERVFKELKTLKDDFNNKIEEMRGQSERVISLSRELADKMDEMRTGSANAETKRLLEEILTEIDTNSKMAEAKAALWQPESYDKQFEDIKADLKELSEMTALVKAAMENSSIQTLEDITARIDEIENDLDDMVEATLDGEAVEKPVRAPRATAAQAQDPMLAETLSGISAQLNSLTERLAVIAEEQSRQQDTINAAFAAQAEATARAEEHAVQAALAAENTRATVDSEAAKALALEAAQAAAEQAAQASAMQAAQAAQQAALTEVANLSAGITNLRDEILSVTNDQSQALSQYMQYFVNEVTTLKTTLDNEVTVIRGDIDKQTQSVQSAIRTAYEPTVQQASAGLDADTAEALNAVLNDIRLNIAQNQEEVNRALAANLENIKQILSERGTDGDAQAAVDRAALMEAVNDIRTLSYNQIESTTGDPAVTANDISEILNEINLLRQDVVRQTATGANGNDDFLQQFGSAVMEDFQYLKDEVAALSATATQNEPVRQLAEEVKGLKELVVEQNSIIETQNSIAEGQAAESAAQAEAISAIREAIASLPDELRLTVAGAQNLQPVENLSLEISVLRAMIEEQSKQIPTAEELESLASQISSIRALIGENPTLANDYQMLNDLSSEITSLRTTVEGRSYPDNADALSALQEEIASLKTLIGQNGNIDALFAIREDIDSVKSLIKQNAEAAEAANANNGSEAYESFKEALNELRAEFTAHSERMTENYTQILTAAQDALTAAQTAADTAQTMTLAPMPTQEIDTSGINENITMLRDELANRLVPDTFVVMDALKELRTDLEANLAARDAQREELVNGQIASLASEVAEYTAPGAAMALNESALEFIKKEIKGAKDAVLYSIYRDNVYAENMREDLMYLSDQLYYISENMVDGFAMTAGGNQNRDLLLEIGRYVDTLRHDMTNRIMQDADAFNSVNKTLTGLQSELKGMITDNNKTIAALNSDNNKAIVALNKENASLMKDTVSGLKAEFRETYGALKLDHNTVLANILNTLKSLRADLITEVVKGRDVDDRRVLSELAVIKNEIAAARSKGIAVTEKTAGAVTIEDLKSELSGIAEIVKNNKKTTRTTTTTTRKATPSSSRKTTTTKRTSSISAPKKSTSSATKSITGTSGTRNPVAESDAYDETVITTVEEVIDEGDTAHQTSTQTQTAKSAQMQAGYSASAAEMHRIEEVNEMYEYDGQRYTREQLKLAQALAAKIADRMVVDKLAEKLDTPSVLTVAEEMLKNKNDNEDKD